MGQGQAGDPNLGLKYFLNGALVSNIVLDTSAVELSPNLGDAKGQAAAV
jgi:hypothetical protein